ncbi:MAG: response regulator [Armatimonadota bacterium]|nr:MAG: response regulator [Armatimonadota bacterium]
MSEDADSKQAQRETPRPRVMLVEDEFVVSLALKMQLEAVGCEVVGTADNADSAIEMACDLRPDVILMDIGLPGKNGVCATREIMARAPTRIVMVTAYGDERLQQALDAGALLALVKPVLEHQLKQAIMKVSAKPAPESASGETSEA